MDSAEAGSNISFHSFAFHSGEFIVRAFAQDAFGGHMWVQTIVNISNNPPLASFTFSPSSPTTGQTITFDASSSYDPNRTITSYQWNFGDGSIASGIIVTHSYSSAGTYTVTLTVTDNDGLQASISKQVTISPYTYEPII